MSPWVSVAVTVVIGTLGLGCNAVLIAFFLGKMRQQQAGFEQMFSAYQGFQRTIMEQLASTTRQAIDALNAKASEFDAFADGSAHDRARLNVRMEQVEANTSALRGLHDTVLTMNTRQEMAHQAQREASERMQRDITGLQRQVANIAASGLGSASVVTLPAQRAQQE